MDPGYRSPLIDLFLRGEAAREVRLLAAQGALAPRAQEQLALLVVLSDDPDPEVARATAATLDALPADALRAVMYVPEIRRLVFSTLTSRLTQTEAADLPRLAGPDQEALRDLRTPRPIVEAVPRPSTGESSA